MCASSLLPARLHYGPWAEITRRKEQPTMWGILAKDCVLRKIKNLKEYKHRKVGPSEELHRRHTYMLFGSHLCHPWTSRATG